MPLKKIPVAPGFDKQDTASQAEGRWIDGDNVRFRYGNPEKIGGWSQILAETLVGAARNQWIWSDLEGNRYAAIGTNNILAIYFEGAFYDITPLDTALTSCTFNTTTGSTTVTVNKASHGLTIGRIVRFSFGTPPTGFSAANFTNAFEVKTTPTDNTFTITMPVVSSATASTSGTATCNPYYYFGPFNQTYGYGFGTFNWGGFSSTVTQNAINVMGGINNSTTTIVVDSTTGFAATGTLLIDSELITYTGKTATDFTGCGRGASGTTAAAHADNTIVYNASTFVGWGQASTVAAAINLDPANWSLDNFGQVLIATMHNGPTFTWNPSAIDALNTRAVINASMPQKSVMTIVSDRDRHLIHLGTNETLPNGAQDKMLIRFSDQEDYNVYAPTSTNTAGTFRLDAGTKIVAAIRAKDYILILTDDAAYSMQFVGPPFTFSIRKVGSNCGCLGQHAVVFAQGIVFWMGDSGGFFAFDGTVVSVPSLVEDFVFTTTGDNLGINYDASETVFAAHNSLFQEIMWFYTKYNSTEIDRVVTYNYGEKVWTTGTMSSATVGSQSRTTYADASVYDAPHATKFVAAATPTFPIVNGVSAGASIYYQHEVGVNEVASSGTITAIPANIRSGDFDLDIDGDGEYFLSVKRFIPDFKTLDGDCKVTLFLRSYPADTTVAQGETFIGPFTVNSSTDKIDTRGRARLASIKIENDAIDTNWRYGIFRVDIQPDGRR
jgi:hypothetical protein